MAMRRRLAQQGFGADHGFRWRGGETSRLEGPSDAVFAFAVCFAILFWVWYDHYRASWAEVWLVTRRGILTIWPCSEPPSRPN